MPKELKLKQPNTSNILIDNTERDVIIIWFEEKDDPQCCHVERENIQALIDMLEKCKKKN